MQLVSLQQQSEYREGWSPMGSKRRTPKQLSCTHVLGELVERRLGITLSTVTKSATDK